MSRSVVLVFIVGLVALGQTACSEVAAPAAGTTCTPNPCLNGGTCIQGDGRVTCECAPGWRPPLCEARDACAGAPCGVGSCSDAGAGGYTCLCPAGTFDSGTTCTACKPVDNCETVSCTSIEDATCTDCRSGYSLRAGGCDPIVDCTGNPCGRGECTGTGVGSYRCDCHDGFYDDGSTCASCDAIANCAVVSCTSAANETCATCATGYEPNGSGGCRKIYHCLPDPCNGGTCTEGVNGYDCSACPPGKYDDGSTCASCDAIANCTAVTCTSAANETCATCAPGYEPNGSGGCKDSSDCSPNPCNGGTCTDTGVNSYDCSACPTGKYDDGSTCASCDAIANCTAVTCTSAANETCATCATGFERNGAGGCDDIDDCRSRPCGSGTEFKCTDIGVSAWSCDCPDGYFGDGGTTCTPCASSAVVGCNAVTCTAAGASTCAGCGAGYRLEGGTCVDIDDCAGHAACGSPAWCVDGVATFSCDCPDGYFGDGTKACTPCSASPVTGCTAVTCTRAGISTCVACAAGYDLVSGSCRNIDDCQPGSCGVGRCIDGLSAFTCDCPDGTYGDGTTTCTACTPSSSPGCQAVTCTGPGPSTCTACAAGFTLSSGVCVDIDDCTGGRCAPGTCTDSGPSSWTCNCPDAFYGDGTTTCSACTPIEGCLALTCTSGGASTCSACASGYALSGGQCVNINDCPGHGCGVGTCLDGINGYTCDCPVGTFGDGTTTCTACDAIPGCDSVRCTSANDEVCTCGTSFDCHPAAPACVVAGQTGTCVVVDECLGDDPYEHGDDGPAGAYFVGAGWTVIDDGLICGNAGTPSGDEADWFGITLNDGQDLRVMLAWTGPSRDLDLEVYTADGQLIGSSAGVANPEDVSFADLPVGAYYLRVFSYSGDANQAAGYVLTVDTECDGDFGFCPASAPVCLGAGASSTCGTVDVCAGDDAREPSDDGPRGASVAEGPRTVFTGAICDSAQGAERDWYRVFVPDGGELRAKLAWTVPGVDLDLNVRDANGLVIRGGYSGLADREEVDLGSLPGGDYYLELWSHGAPDTAVAYTFTVDAVAPGSLCDPSIFAFCPAQAPVCLGSGQASCGTVDVCAGDDAREPADDGPRGASLAAGPRTVFTGAICDSAQGAERDWYKVSVAAGQDLRAKVTWTTPGVDLDFYIRDGAGQIIQSATSGAGYIEELSLSGLAGGDYYVELWSHAGAPGTAVAYTMTLDTFTLDTPCDGYFAFCPAQAPACAGTGGAARCAIVDACNGDDAREHLDDGPQGASFATGPRTVFASSICDSAQGAERDWYKVSVAAGQDLRAKVTWTTPGVDLDFNIRAADGQIIQFGTSGAGYIEELGLSGLPGGDYYVELWSHAGAPDNAVAYTMTLDTFTLDTPCDGLFGLCPSAAAACVGNHAAARCGVVDACAMDDAREPWDDGPAGATLVPSPGQSFDGYLCGGPEGPAAWESDWFRVEVDEGDVLYAVWLGDFDQAGDLDLVVRDNAGVLWGRSDAFANPDEIALSNLPAGAYYLELRAFDDEGSPAYYLLDVSTCPAADGCASPICTVAGAPYCLLCADGFDSDGNGGCEAHDACQPDPCQNGGTCVGTGPNQYWCMCQDGYVGPDCETFIGQCQTDFDCPIEEPVCWVDAGVGSCLASGGCLDDDLREELDDGPWGGSFVAAGETVVGRVCDTSGEYDWYWVTVEDEPLRVTLDWTATVADLDLYVFDEAGQVVASSAAFARPESIMLALAAQGDYWLRVSAFSGAPASAIEYTLQVTQECWGPIECPSWAPACIQGQCVVVDGCVDDDGWEHADDGPQGAFWVPLGTELDKRICGAHDAATASESDWVAITLDAGQPLTVELAWADASVDLDLYLIDPSGQVSLSSAGSDRPERITAANHPAGPYYAVVVGWSGAPVNAIDYRLSLGDIDDCSPDPCGGSGCTDTGVDSFQCGMQFHGGPVMTAPINVYYVWYGDWQGNTGTKILEDFARSVGGSPRWATNSTYSDAFGVPVSDTVSFAGRTFDGYSRGTELDYADIWGIVADAIGTGWLPLDPDGVYFVLTAADVTVADLCASYCGWHWYGGLDGVDVKYSLVANAELACPESCGVMDPSPNGNPGADAMASILMHELEEAATDPLLNAWYDGIGLENSDKCAWSFGEVYSTGTGALANVRLGARDFLIQQNWVNASGGYCALRYPPLTPSGALVPLSASLPAFTGAVPGHSARENPRFPVAAPRPAADGN